MSDTPRKFPWIWSLVLILTTGSTFGLAFLLGQSSAPRPVPKPTSSPMPQDALVRLGYVDLEYGVPSLTPLNSGRIVKVLVKENEPVKAGQVLLQLDDKAAQHRVAEAEAALASARNQLSQACKGNQTHQERLSQQRASVEVMNERRATAQLQLSRKEELEQIGQAKKQDVAMAQHQVKELLAMEKAEQGKLAELELVDPNLEVRSARAQVELMEARLEQARDALNECQLKAPQAGRVLRILAGPGDVVGGSVRQPVILFATDTPRLVRVEIEQEQARRVKSQMQARIVDETDPTQVWTGKVERVSDWCTQQRSILREGPTLHDMRTVECLVSLDQGQPVPRLGLRVEVTFLPDEPQEN